MVNHFLARAKNRRSGKRAHRRKGLFTSLLAVVGTVGLIAGVIVTASAASADTSSGGSGTSNPQYLSITKTVDGASSKTLTAGDSFTYQITVKCSEQNCVNAALTDALPADLNGFLVTAVSSGSSLGQAVTVTWSGGSQPSVVGSDTTFTATPNQSFTGGTGLTVGSTFYVNLTLQVPDDFSPLDSRNGTPIVNTGVATADNSADASAQATVTVSVPQKLAVTVNKTWSPSTASYAPGASSTVTLTAKNTSNVPLDTIVVQDPKASLAADGATTLDANNPFRITDFAGFDASSALPSGATAVQVDAYVLSNGTWSWVTGTAGTSYALPSGVSNSEVGGLRFTYTGTEIALKATATAVINLTQRSTDRNTGGDLSTSTSTITNVAQAQGSRGSVSSTIVTGSATYTVSPASIGTSIAKSFSPNRLPAGNSTVGTITAKNTASAVQTLIVSDYTAATPFFTSTVTFGGFTQGVAWPQGATSGTVKYYLLSGGTEEYAFANGAVPQSPSADIAGFDLVFSAPADSIVKNAQAIAKFAVNTSSTVNFGASATLSSTNTATSTVTAVNGQNATDTDSATLTQVTPKIGVTLSKTVKPSTAIQPGQSTIVSLSSTTNSSSDYLKPTSIVVEDSWGSGQSATGFWNAFDLTSIQSTQIPANTSLVVEVQKSDGTWVTLTTVASSSAVQTFGLSSTAFTAKLATLGLTPSDLIGVKFTFANSSGFAASTTVDPYLGFTARSTLRSTGATVDTTGTTGTTYTNSAVTTGTGKTDDGTTVTGNASGTGKGSVVVYPSGTGNVGVSKSWAADTTASASGSQTGAGTSVDAQSAETRITHLNWGVDSGYASVILTDPANSENDASQTVFNAFNLKAINAIAASSTPYTNGWYLKYDTISSVELYNGTNWVTITAPSGSWQNSDGSFKGYTLSAAEQASTQGVRITVVPNDTARANSTDPYAPEAGTGVVSTSTSSFSRSFDLTWQLRNTLRVQGSNSSTWVTAESSLNGGTGVVDNTVGIAAAPLSAGSTVTASADAKIAIINQPPGVTVTKTVANNSLIVPAPGSGGTYPTTSYTLTAKNNSTTRAQYVRVTDPATCTDSALAGCQTENTAVAATGDPFSASFTGSDIDTADVPNPFNRQDITKVTVAASIAGEVDLSKSVVWLLEYDRNAASTDKYTVVQSTAAAVNAMSSSDLANVVGVSVAFQGTDPETTGGTISSSNALTVTLSTQVRATLRDTGADQTFDNGASVSSENRAFAQSYDLVTAPLTKTGDVSSAVVALSSGIVDVTATKTITDGAIVEPNRTETQTVTLAADQGTSTAPADKVVLEDQGSSEDFWNNFNFTGLTSVTAPSGANQVQIDVYGPFGTGGALTWVTGSVQSTTASSFVLPVAASQYADVQGIRITFSRSDGAVFSTSTPNWSAQVKFTAQLRSTVRGTSAAVSFPGSATDTVSAQAFGKLDTSDVKQATASVSWTAGTHVLALNKLANNGTRTAQVGSMVLWDITLSNSGTGYLDLSTIVDTLPNSLVYTGSGPSSSIPAVQFTPDTATGSTLTTKPTVDSSVSGQISFSWPEGENRLQPGETATIRVWLELEPGLSSGEKAVNTVTANTVQSLDSCVDTNRKDGSADVTFDLSTPTSCSTSDYVTPTTGPNLFVVKGVVGSLSGATNTSDSTQACTPTLTVGGTSYYRSPCAANSEVGGTDKWVLHVVNGGTTNVTSATIFDQLPTTGDTYLVAGTSRGSDYRSELLNDLAVDAPAGTTETVQVTTSSGVCVGTWANLEKQTPCAQNGETWANASASTDWSTVTGIRVVLDFTTTTAGALTPGQEVNITYSSKNVPASATNVSGASADVPATDQYSWNQFGVKYKDATQAGFSKIAPNAVGVHLRTGSIEVTKTATGDAAAYAPQSVTASVTCTVDGTALTFGGKSSKTVTLTKGSDGAYTPVRVSGIPVGAECAVTEDGSTGLFGETARSVSPSTLSVDEVDTYAASDATESGTPTNAVPTAQVFSITNEYDYSGLSITKEVATDATVGTFGPFTFTLTCSTALGTPITLDSSDAEFTLSAGATHTVTANTIPARAQCVLTEVGSTAQSTSIVGDNVVDHGNGSATITPGINPAAVTVTNVYDPGHFTVAKTVSGTGANYATAEFQFHATCTYNGETVLDETFGLHAGDTKTFADLFPGGTVCSATETDAGGATSTTVTPSTSQVTIVDQANTTITVNNRFDVGSLTVSKKLDGAYASAQTATSFPFSAQCTFEGSQVLDANFSLVGGENRTFAQLPVGATCVVTERDSGGADGVTYSVDNGTVGLSTATPDAIVTVTNLFSTVPPSSSSAAATGLADTAAGSGLLLGAISAGIGAIILGLMALALALLQRRRRRQ